MFPSGYRKRWRLLGWFCALLVVVSVFAPNVRAAQGGPAPWVWRAPLPQGNDLSDVAFGNGEFVAVGAKGTILRSANGVDWELADSGTTEHLNKVTYGNKTFVVSVATGLRYSDDDGRTWHSTWGYNRGPVAFARDRFWRFGENVIYSTGNLPDPKWEQVFSNPVPPGILALWDFTDLNYFNGMFLALRSDNSVQLSKTGTEWTEVSGVNRSSGGYYEEETYEHEPRYLSSAVWGAGRYVTVGSMGNFFKPGRQYAISSSDGRHWDSAFQGPYGSLNDIVYAAGRFIAVGTYGTILTSIDGVEWTRIPSQSSYSLTAVTFGNGRFVAVGMHGVILTSIDGLSWDLHTSGPWQDLWSVTEGKGIFVATGGVGTILASEDAIHWTSVKSHTNSDLVAITYGGERFVAAGRDGTFAVSTNGLDWTVSSVMARDFVGLAYGAGTYLAVTWSQILRSSDGSTWESVPFGGSGLGEPAFGNGLFVLPGIERRAGQDKAVIHTSKDGREWKTVEFPSLRRLSNATFSDGEFMVIGPAGQTVTSSDGVNWQILCGEPIQNDLRPERQLQLTDVVSADGQLWATDSYGKLAVFQDGKWVPREIPTYSDLQGIAFGKGQLVAVGEIGAILSSSVYGITSGVQADPSVSTITAVPRQALADGVSSTTVTVTVLDHAGRPIKGSSVLLKRASGPILVEPSNATSDDLGNARFKVTSPITGVAELSAQIDGKPMPERITVSFVSDNCEVLFTDVRDLGLACGALSKMVAKGVVTGYQDATFRPYNTVTRAEFAKMLLVASGLKPQAHHWAFDWQNTEDVLSYGRSSHWSTQQGYLQPVLSMFWMNGYADSSAGPTGGWFKPDASISRAEAVKVVASATGLSPQNIDAFDDVSVSDWYSGWVGAAVRGGLIGSDTSLPIWSTRTFGADLPVTRLEAMLLLTNYMEIVDRRTSD